MKSLLFHFTFQAFGVKCRAADSLVEIGLCEQSSAKTGPRMLEKGRNEMCFLNDRIILFAFGQKGKPLELRN